MSLPTEIVEPDQAVDTQPAEVIESPISEDVVSENTSINPRRRRTIALVIVVLITLVSGLGSWLLRPVDNSPDVATESNLSSTQASDDELVPTLSNTPDEANQQNQRPLRRANEEQIVVKTFGSDSGIQQAVLKKNLLSNFEKVIDVSSRGFIRQHLIPAAHAQASSPSDETSVLLYLNPQLPIATQLMAMDTNTFEHYQLAEFDDTVLNYKLIDDKVYVYSYRTLPLDTSHGDGATDSANPNSEWTYDESKIDHNLFVLDLETTEVKLLSTEKLTDLSVSPDGTKVLAFYYLPVNIFESKLYDTDTFEVREYQPEGGFFNDIRWVDNDTVIGRVAGQYFGRTSLTDMFGGNNVENLGPRYYVKDDQGAAGSLMNLRVGRFIYDDGIIYHTASEQSDSYLGAFEVDTGENYLLPQEAQSMILNPKEDLLYVLSTFSNEGVVQGLSLKEISIDIKSQAHTSTELGSGLTFNRYNLSIVGWDGSYNRLLISQEERAAQPEVIDTQESIYTYTYTLWSYDLGTQELSYLNSITTKAGSMRTGLFD